ncbi:hypothetical protein [Herbiconiux sp. A18JL235]|uniref:Uncharacterized protein n=1 Tax=Herbiconiux sp. A18JL235 TaxID=3152363 RepID=A0AB39BD94_9MICO
MTTGSGRRAARPRPPLSTAVLALPAGGLLAARLGVGAALLAFLPDTVLQPSPLGGTGSPEILLYAVFWASAAGAALGVALGTVLAVVTVVLWTLRAPSVIVAGAGGAAVAAVLFAAVLLVSPDPQSLGAAALGSLSGAGGAVLLAWAGDRRARSLDP